MRLTALACLSLLASPALAQEKPVTFPTRDVTVRSQVAVAAAYKHEHVTSYLASERKERIELDGSPMYTLIDHKGKIMIQVYPGEPATYISGPFADVCEPKYHRTGQKERIAEYECDVWDSPPMDQTMPGMASAYKTKSTSCITSDGIILRSIVETVMQGNLTRTVLEASTVKYGRLDPALFRLPAGARRQ